MYTLFTDTDKLFNCNIDVDGISLQECRARIILEHPQLNMVFNGTIGSNGTVNIPIKKLKNLLPENAKGTMKLEIIADTSLFEAWTSEFKVDTEKKVSITEVNDNPITEKKRSPSIVVKINEETPAPKGFKKPTLSNKIAKHVSILEAEIKKLNATTEEQFNKVVETYGSITKRKNILTENDMKVIKKQLIKKIF